MTIFLDTEHNRIITLEELEKEFSELVKEDPSTYDFDFPAYIENCLTVNNGTLERMN